MQSQIKLHLAAIPSGGQTDDPFYSCSAMPLRMAQVQKFGMNQGCLLVQSASHYLAHIELFEYKLEQQANIHFSVNEPSFFMYANLNQNSCWLCYRPAGKYQETIASGAHQLLLITFRPDWLIYKCHKMEELKPFTAFYRNAESAYNRLPSFDIAANLFNALQKMDAKGSDLIADADGYIFINHCLNKYYRKLAGQNPTHNYHLEKAAAIARFVKENYASAMVDDLPKIADRFMVSERSLARLARLAFGIPLHEQVINLRMASAFSLLSTTNKPIYEIAQLNGYNDPHYFSKAFKKYYGILPKSVEKTSKKLSVQEKITG
ncbi:helix-turn-helix transcriptional regulator [Pedobacter heparinus]|nr:helix-turn-helix transcriptional regulator [Pedobacter heparinus]